MENLRIHCFLAVLFCFKSALYLTEVNDMIPDKKFPLLQGRLALVMLDENYCLRIIEINVIKGGQVVCVAEVANAFVFEEEKQSNIRRQS